MSSLCITGAWTEGAASEARGPMRMGRAAYKGARAEFYCAITEPERFAGGGGAVVLPTNVVMLWAGKV